MSREAHVPFYEGLGVQFPRPTHRFALSFRDVEDLLAQRGITVTYETIRQWCLTFGRDYARTLRRRRGQQGDTWHLDELFVTLNGRQQYLWRAVDEDGDVLDILVQSRRNRHAAVRFFRKLLKRQGCVPRRLITDKLRSYPAACRTAMPSVVHCTDQYANNRAEVSLKRPRFSWTRIKGESNVQGGGENGSVEGCGTGRGIGTTGVRADGAAAGAGSLAPGQRWSASRKRDVVLRLLRGASLEALSREAFGVWREATCV